MTTIAAVSLRKRIDLIFGMLASVLMILLLMHVGKKDNVDNLIFICLTIIFALAFFFYLFLLVYISGKITIDENFISYDTLFLHKKILCATILSLLSESDSSGGNRLIVKTEGKTVKIPFAGKDAAKLLYDFRARLFEQKLLQWLETVSSSGIRIEFVKGFRLHSYQLTFSGIRNTRTDVFVPWEKVQTSRTERPEGILYGFNADGMQSIKVAYPYRDLSNELQLFFDAVIKQHNGKHEG